MGHLQQLKDRIRSYQLEGSTLGNLGYTRILLQVCGSAGNGKSSLINSFKFALHDEKFSISAPVAPALESQGGFTMVRLSYELTEVITLVDNRGFGKLDSFEKEEVYTQLANFQPLNQTVTWDLSYQNRMELVTSAALNTNDLLVPIFVHSVEYAITENVRAEIMEFFKTTQKITGFLPVVVITKKLKGDAEKMHQEFKKMGAEKVFEVENYIEEDKVKSPGKDQTFLTILSCLLDLVDFVANSVVPTMDSPDKEHLKRVQMLLKMANDNDIQRKKKEWEKTYVPPPLPPKPKGKGCVLM